MLQVILGVFFGFMIIYVFSFIREYIILVKIENIIKTIEYFYDGLYDFCRKSDQEIYEDLVTQIDMLDMNGNSKSTDMSYYKYTIRVNEGMTKKELAQELLTLLETLQKEVKKHEKEYYLLLNGKENISRKIYNVKTIIWNS